MSAIRTLPDGSKTKYCSGCERTLTIDRFDRDNTKKSGIHSRCKDCRSKKNPKHRAYKPTGPGPRVPKPAPKPKPKPRPTRDEDLIRARQQAILDLIETHRAEFETLVYQHRNALQRKAAS